MDGRPVRERDERLSRLLAEITPDSLEQARLIAAESARFNLNPRGVKLNRTINTPMIALLFLRTANQPRSTFRLGRTERIDGLTCVTLNFQELAEPRGHPNQATAPRLEGRSGLTSRRAACFGSDLRLDASGGRRGPKVHSQITVKYAHVAKLDLWLPESMDESYDLFPSRQVVSGHGEDSDTLSACLDALRRTPLSFAASSLPFVTGAITVGWRLPPWGQPPHASLFRR